jgi:hypothetical protein
MLSLEVMFRGRILTVTFLVSSTISYFTTKPESHIFHYFSEPQRALFRIHVQASDPLRYYNGQLVDSK